MDDYLKEFLNSPAFQEALKEPERLRKWVAEAPQKPVAMDTAENFHAMLRRYLAVLHKIARLPCQTDPEGMAELEASSGYRSKRCKSDECASCLAWKALMVDGRLPF